MPVIEFVFICISFTVLGFLLCLWYKEGKIVEEIQSLIDWERDEIDKCPYSDLNKIRRINMVVDRMLCVKRRYYGIKEGKMMSYKEKIEEARKDSGASAIKYLQEQYCLNRECCSAYCDECYVKEFALWLAK